MSTWTVPAYGEEWTVPGFTERRELGQRAAGRVVEAVHDASGRRVALRYLSPSLLGDPDFMQRFRVEARMLPELDTPNVVRVHDFVEQPGQGAALISELVSGVSLDSMIDRRGPLSPQAALTVLKSMLTGLAAAHALRIAHRDCKPGNVLVDTAGNVKLGDFCLAVLRGGQVPTEGTPAYLAPERWHGAPARPAADIYAATAVFYECLTGRAPFSGSLPQLQAQHEAAGAPLNQIDPPLRELVLRGMAKDPARRPHSAIAFVSELESVATFYGPDWKEQGRAGLAESASAMLAQRPGDGAGPPRGSRQPSRGREGRKRRLLAIASVAAAAVVLIGGAATAVTLQAQHRGHATGQPSGGASAQVVAATPSFTAVANVTPPVAASNCTTETKFSYSGTLSATTPATVKYQWVYSTGKPGPVQTVRFAGAGHQVVTGETAAARTASSGWGEIKLLSPVARSSNEAAYRLLCGGSSVGGVTAAAAVTPASRTASCATAPPDFTATGSVKAAKAEQVTYYWALSDGVNTAPATLSFTGPGTRTVQPLPIAPAQASGAGEAVLVVTSPVTVASSPATYTLICKAPAQTTSPASPASSMPPTTPAAAAAGSSPAASPATATTPATSQGLSASASVSPANYALTSCLGNSPTETFTGSISDSAPGVVSYHWALPNGNGPTQELDFTQPGTQPVASAGYDIAFGAATGSGTLVVTSPVSLSSNAAVFTVTCPSIAPSSSGLNLVTGTMRPSFAYGEPYTGVATVTGGTGPYTWTATGLPPGLTATPNGASETFSGAPAATGTFNLVLSVRDSSSPAQTDSKTISIFVQAVSMAVTVHSSLSAVLGQPYSASVTATGGDGTYNWTGTFQLPTGLTATPNGGTLVISGTPTALGTWVPQGNVSDSASEPTPETLKWAFSVIVGSPAASS